MVCYVVLILFNLVVFVISIGGVNYGSIFVDFICEEIKLNLLFEYLFKLVFVVLGSMILLLLGYSDLL